MEFARRLNAIDSELMAKEFLEWDMHFVIRFDTVL